MDLHTVTRWFAAYQQQQVRQQRLVALGFALLGVVVLLAEWAMTVLVLLIVCWPFVGRNVAGSWVLLGGSLLVVPLLFAAAAWSDPKQEIDDEEATGEPLTAAHGTAASALLATSGVVGGLMGGHGSATRRPARARTGFRLVGAYLLSGPRFISLAREQLQVARRLAAVDGARVTPIIAVLYAQDHKVPFPALVAAVPGIDPSRDFPLLEQVDGILFLQAPPPGLALGSDLRASLARALADPASVQRGVA